MPAFIFIDFVFILIGSALMFTVFGEAELMGEAYFMPVEGAIEPDFADVTGETLEGDETAEERTIGSIFGRISGSDDETLGFVAGIEEATEAAGLDTGIDTGNETGEDIEETPRFAGITVSIERAGEEAATVPTGFTRMIGEEEAVTAFGCAEITGADTGEDTGIVAGIAAPIPIASFTSASFHPASRSAPLIASFETPTRTCSFI
jgi:hypothetical protein